LGVAAIQAAHPGQPPLQLFEPPGIDADAVHLTREPDRPGRRLWAPGVAAVCASLALAWWLLRTPERPEAPPPPIGGMVRFSGGNIQPGVFAMFQRPPACASLPAAEDAAVREHPEQVAQVRVAPFELDVHEVTNRQLADWLNVQADAWEATAHGV